MSAASADHSPIACLQADDLLWGSCYMSTIAQMDLFLGVQEGLRRHVLRVLRVWRDWFIFGDDILNGLQV